MKRYTRRTGRLDEKSFADIKSSAIWKAKNEKELKFINSSKFKTEINKQIKLNRVKQNSIKLDIISKSLGGTRESQKIARELFGETTSRTSQGSVRRRNTLSSISQTKRLKKVVNEITKGEFKITKYIKGDEDYKRVKKYLPNGGIGDGDYTTLLESLSRTDFYFENKQQVINYNKLQQKHGARIASGKKAGQILQKRYNQTISAKDKELLKELGFD